MTIRAGVGVLCILGATVVGSISDGPPAPPTALRMGEDRVSYAERYDEWLSTIPETDRAWETVKSVSESIEELGLSDAEIVKAHPDLVERLHSLVESPALGMPTIELGISPDDDPEDTELLLGLLLPHVSMLRANARLLIADTKLAEDPDRVLLNLRAIQQLEQYCSIVDTMIEGLVIIEFDNQMFDIVLADNQLLNSFNRQQLKELASIFDFQHAWEPATRFVRSERAMEENFLDWIYIDSVEDHLSLRGAKRLIRLETDDEPKEVMAQILQNSVGPRSVQAPIFDIAELAAITDLTEPIAGKSEFASRSMLAADELQPDKHGLRYSPVGLMLPAYDRFVLRVLTARTKRDASRFVISAYRHRELHGEFPSSVAEIDDNLLPNPPIDPYTGKPLRIRIEGDRVVIYSLGPDLDDDQGRALSEHRFVLRAEYEGFDEQQLQDWDGDWVLTAPN